MIPHGLRINGKTKVVGLFGDPVIHSLSPKMQNTAFCELGLNYCYLPFHISKEALPAAIEAIKTLGMAGVNITAPHKESAVNILDELSPDATLLNAVNTVKNNGGKLSGYNTDVDGFIYLLKNSLTVPFEKAVLLGAGGAARAVVLALFRLGIKKIMIANRTVKHAETFVKQLCDKGAFSPGQVEIISLNSSKVSLAAKESLLINALSADPVEMGIITSGALHHIHAAVDLRYTPPIPTFLQAAKSCGRLAVNGLDMLLGQGISAFEIITGVSAPRAGMKKALTESSKMDNKTKIFLTGFMGSGKSTTGRLLAKMLGISVYDCDELIVSEQGNEVTQIFKSKGEEYFRRRETEILKMIAQQTQEKCVVSTGGGAVLQEENRSVMRESGLVIYLKVSAKEAYRRLQQYENRPLLNVADPERKISELLQERIPYYQKAHYCINTDGKTPQRVAEEIFYLLRLGCD